MEKSSLACFNGGLFLGAGRNLENYLLLIANNEEPPIAGEYRFHYTNFSKFLYEDEKISDILENDHYDLRKHGEKTRVLFFREIRERQEEIKYEKASDLIYYILEHINEYSVINDDYFHFLELKLDLLDLRGSLSLYIAFLLNHSGWRDESGKSIDNSTSEYISEITDWIFGEKEHKDEGILKRLSDFSKGILGIYDMLEFRSYCMIGGGGSYYNIYDALGYYKNTNYVRTGNGIELLKQQMRIFSQECFSIFKKAYMEKEINVFEQVDNLTLKELTGESYRHVEEKIRDANIESRLVSSQKNSIIIFIIYQLSSRIITNDVGCGFYDEEGNSDGGGINSAMNNYLFNFCFNGRNNKKNYQYFIDFLLLFYDRARTSGKDIYQPNLNKYLQILEKEKFVKYWNENSEEIKKYFKSADKELYIGSRIMSYKNHSEDLFKFLDDNLIKNKI